jgi:DNA-binding NtrC family response regulator
MINQISKILIVDDQKETAETHSAILRELKYEHVFETNPQNVLPLLNADRSINLVLLDIRMPGVNGLEMLVKIKSQFPTIGVIMATVVSDMQEAVKAIKIGAFNYLLKPLQSERLKSVIEAYYDSLPKSIVIDPRFSSYITNDDHFKEIFQRINAFGQADATILIEGETGTGKELIAQIIHSISDHSKGPYVAVNIAAISESLFESELFGHLKGSFTSANKDHKGFIESAENGSLFLDEIGELGIEQQKKLLRLLQNKTYSKVGASTESKMKSRVIFATNKKLKDEVKEKRFREDLFYRISSHTITIPPLRERPNDIMLLAKYFLKKYVSQYGRIIVDFNEDSINCLNNYKYPGNIRELEGIISSAVLLEQTNLVTLASLPYHVKYNTDVFEDLERIKYLAIMKTLGEFNGNQTKAALKLGIARGTLNRILKDFQEKGFNTKIN